MPPSGTEIRFGSYRLDPDAARLWKGHQRVPLQPAYLAARPEVVVGREELVARVWAGVHVTRAVLKVAVRAIRRALEDDPNTPRYIETVGREGYRFVGNRGTAPVPSHRPARPAIVGRARELAALRAAFRRARDGARQVLFVVGEAGIGKTTVIDHFVEELGRERGAAIARGQCLEQYGTAEPYLPVLEALGRLVRDDEAGPLAQALGRHAPTWVPALPALGATSAAPARERRAIAPRPARMLRELGDALEVFTRRRPLVLVLEDLQWSDPSTVELIAYLARRRGEARLMVVGSFRPADVIVGRHPLRAVTQELQANGQSTELALELLSPAEVTAYVARRFGTDHAGAMRRLAARIHERTEGNALFMVNVVNDLVARGVLVARDDGWVIAGSLEEATERIPPGLQEFIARRLERLAPAALRVLEAASVAGDVFTAAAVAAALDDDLEATEDLCARLAAQGGAHRGRGGRRVARRLADRRLRFLHVLCRRVLYGRIGAARPAAPPDRAPRGGGLRPARGRARPRARHALHPRPRPPARPALPRARGPRGARPARRARGGRALHRRPRRARGGARRAGAYRAGARPRRRAGDAAHGDSGLRGPRDGAGVRARPGALRGPARKPPALPGAARARVVSPRARRARPGARARRGAPAPCGRAPRGPRPRRAGTRRARGDPLPRGRPGGGARPSGRRARRVRPDDAPRARERLRWLRPRGRVLVLARLDPRAPRPARGGGGARSRGARARARSPTRSRSPGRTTQPACRSSSSATGPRARRSRPTRRGWPRSTGSRMCWPWPRPIADGRS